MSGTNIVVVTIGAEIVTNESRFHERSPAVSESSGQLAMTFNLNHPIRHDELQQKLLAAGVRIPPTVYFHNEDGRLLVRGTKEQLALVHQMVLKFNGYSTKDSEVETEAFVRQISGFGIEEPPMAPATNLISRHFRVDARLFANALLPTVPDLQTNDVPAMAKRFFSQFGVNLDVPGKSFFFNDGMSELFVKATPHDVDTIEEAIKAFSPPPPQVHIKARFIKVPKTFHLESLMMSLNTNTREFEGVLNHSNVLTVLKELETQKGAESFGEPEVVTTSGRQTQMRATQIVTVITNMAFQEGWTNLDGTIVSNSIVPQTCQIETGPILDVVPHALSDGCTINLALIPSLTEFLGYDNPTNTTVAYTRSGERIDVPKVLPVFRVQRVTITLNLWDNQTAVLGGLPEIDYINGKEVADKSKSSDKELLVLITATLVDPAGNRIHSDDEIPFAQAVIPPQPQLAK